MLDRAMRPLIDPPLNAAGRRLAALGVPANAVTLAGFAVGLAAVPAIGLGHYGWGLAAILASRVFDGLDGAVARVAGVTDVGGYLDIVCDFILYSAWVFGFAVARPEHAVVGAFLMLSFVGTGSSFLAYAVFAAKRGVDTEIHGSKSLYYLGGLTEGTETILAFIAFCLLPQHFVPLALLFAAACWITTVSRILAAVKGFRD
jgi:phosphatidylglycerophosphate synthase